MNLIGSAHIENGSLNVETDLCGICSEKMTDVTLKCKHSYCYECIYDWAKLSAKATSYSYGRKHRECPYCRLDGGWLPLKEGYTPLKNIHKEYSSIVKKTKTVQCNAPLKSNPGATCRNNGKTCYGGYCGVHKKFHNTCPKQI